MKVKHINPAVCVSYYGLEAALAMCPKGISTMFVDPQDLKCALEAGSKTQDMEGGPYLPPIVCEVEIGADNWFLVCENTIVFSLFRPHQRVPE